MIRSSLPPDLQAAVDRVRSRLFQSILAISFAILPTIGGAGDCRRISELESYRSLEVAPGGSTCEVFAGLDAQTGVSCYWEFPFRSANAESYFNDLWTELTNCRQGIQSINLDRVNHPDSYLQNELIAASGTYRVSMKDKGQKRSTWIFLSFESRG